LGGSVHSGKKNTEASVVASERTGVEVNGERTKYMAILDIRMQEKSQYKDRRVEQFKYWEHH
jgi:hypothetical protein